MGGKERDHQDGTGVIHPVNEHLMVITVDDVIVVVIDVNAHRKGVDQGNGLRASQPETRV